MSLLPNATSGDAEYESGKGEGTGAGAGFDPWS